MQRAVEGVVGVGAFDDPKTVNTQRAVEGVVGVGAYDDPKTVNM